MRCKNCGWENPDTNTKCEKCNTPLVESENKSVQMPQDSPWSLDGKSSDNIKSSATISKTVCEGAFFPPEQVQPQCEQPSANTQSGTCPACGYPLRPGVHVCPNCNYGLQLPTQESSIVAQPQQSGISGTVNPWVNIEENADAPTCRLTPIKHGNELHAPQPKQFSGEINELNRSCLDAENMTITSNVQARLTYENGKWFIEDASSQHTTYIHVGGKTELKDGDVILMGNRQFVFNK